MAKSTRPKTMEELLASLSKTSLVPSPGSEVEGEIVSVNSQEIVVDLGLKSEGVIAARELEGVSPKVGDKIKALVGEGENESGQIILTFTSRQTLKPRGEISSKEWDALTEKLEKEEVIKGKVAKATQFGVFVTLPQGVEGLIHSSNLRPDDTFEVGKEISVTIDNLDKDKKRISLSPVLTSTKGLIYK